MRTAIKMLTALAVAGMTVWSAGALYYSPLLDLSLRPGGAAIFVMATLLAFIFLPRRGPSMSTRAPLRLCSHFFSTAISSTGYCSSNNGGILGLALGHWLISLGAHFIKIETGVGFTAGYLSTADWLVIPGTALLGLLAGLVPGIQAYRLGVLKNLSPVSG